VKASEIDREFWLRVERSQRREYERSHRLAFAKGDTVWLRVTKHWPSATLWISEPHDSKDLSLAVKSALERVSPFFMEKFRDGKEVVLYLSKNNPAMITWREPFDATCGMKNGLSSTQATPISLEPLACAEEPTPPTPTKS